MNQSQNQTDLQRCACCGKAVMGQPFHGAKVSHLACAMARTAEVRARFQAMAQRDAQRANGGVQ